MTRLEFFRDDRKIPFEQALALCAAEDQASRGGFSFEWGKEADGKYYCICRDETGQYAESRVGIDFAGEDVWSSPMRRVVQADLARLVFAERNK